MNLRRKEWILVVSFLAIIAAPALLQTIQELRRGATPQALDVFRERPTVTHLRGFERELEDVSWVAQQLRSAVQYAQFKLLREAGDRAIIGRDGWMFYKPGVRYLIERPEPFATSASTNRALSAMVAFRDALAQRNIGLLVMIAPNKESIYPEQLSRRARAGEVVVGPQTRQVLDGLQQAGVEVVDLFEAFRIAKRNSGPGVDPPLYLAQDSHWSPRGVEVAAQTVARTLRDRGWNTRRAVAYDVHPITVRRVGDVIRMLRVPRLERETAPEVIHCQQVVQRDTQQPYQDDPDAELLVLGDSFLRMYEQDEPKAAGFVAHLARLLRQPVASIINDGGASTLVRQELHRRPHLLARTKLVIWEFVERDIRFGTEGWQQVPLPPPTATASHGAFEAKQHP